jgi:hypothetical protein
MSGFHTPNDLHRGLCERIRQNFVWISSWSAVAAAICAPHCSAAVAGPAGCWKDVPRLSTASTPSVCSDPTANSQIKQALRLVCLQSPVEGHLPTTGQRAIVIGFLGGFARHGDLNHPEVWFAEYLREHYTSAVYAEVFSNHEADAALRDVFNLLDTDCDGTLTASEKRNARIILYGHSWGASQTIAFARKLEKLDIPVLLTVQIDIVSKPGQNSIEVPSNVEHAVNFFQSTGFLRGQPQIVAVNAARTNIIGNFHMTYRNHSVDCGNYPWFARTFNKPHHEIENDSRVWEQVNSLITNLRIGSQKDDQTGIAEQ